MKIILTEKEIDLLRKARIDFTPDTNYDDDLAFALLDKVYDAEVYYAQSADTSESARVSAVEYARIADSIQAQIPE